MVVPNKINNYINYLDKLKEKLIGTSENCQVYIVYNVFTEKMDKSDITKLEEIKKKFNYKIIPFDLQNSKED